MDCWRVYVDAADARKAGIASVLAHRIPSPPALTGSVACVRCVSSKSTLRIDESPVLRTASNFNR